MLFITNKDSSVSTSICQFLLTLLHKKFPRKEDKVYTLKSSMKLTYTYWQQCDQYMCDNLPCRGTCTVNSL